MATNSVRTTRAAVTAIIAHTDQVRPFTDDALSLSASIRSSRRRSITGFSLPDAALLPTGLARGATLVATLVSAAASAGVRTISRPSVG